MNRNWLIATLALLSSASELAAQTTTRVDVDSHGGAAVLDSYYVSMSRDGRWIAFDGYFGDSPYSTQIYLHDRATGLTILVSEAVTGGMCDFGAHVPCVTPDGRVVAFESDAHDLVLPDGNPFRDVFVRDVVQGANELVSVAAAGGAANGPCEAARVTPDGRFVVYRSNATNLVNGDTNGVADVFLRDRTSATTTRESVGAGAAQSNGSSIYPSVSDDGRFVCFESDADNLVPNDTNGYPDVFLRDRSTDTTRRINLRAGGQQTALGGYEPFLSGDGSRVVYYSDDDQIVAGDGNGTDDVFARDLATSTNLLVSATPSGGFGSSLSYYPFISSTGRFVVFKSFANDLVSGDTNFTLDTFVRDLQAGTTERVNLDHLGHEEPSNNWANYGIAVSDDGRYAAFQTLMPMIAGDVEQRYDIFLRDRFDPSAPVVSYCTAKTNSAGCVPAISSASMPSLSGFDAFVVTAVGVLPHKSCILFWGAAGASLPFGGGILCVQPPLLRSPVLFAEGNGLHDPCSGFQWFRFDQAYMAAYAVVPGQTIYAQFWSRDPGFAAPNNVGLTDALRFTVAP